MTRWRSGLGALGVSVATVALVVLDIADDAVRAWGVDHALTSATVTGLLVLLITVLVVDQVTDLRQARGRERAVAAQGAMLLAQAVRSLHSAGAALDGSGAREDAEHEIRTYMLMLLVSSPVLIGEARPRAFLEEAQRLGVQMTTAVTSGADGLSAERLADAEARIRAAAEPLLGVLDPAERESVLGG